MKKIYIVLLFILISILIGSAQTQKIEAYKGVIPGGYNFWLVHPLPDSCSQKPLIIFLHGASLCGRNLDRVRHYGPLDAIERGRAINAYIIAPQNPGGGWKPSKVHDVFDWVKNNHDIDTTRIYVIGMSLGGFGTIDYTATYPDEVAAAIGICGGATVRDLSHLNEVPLWIVHGTADRAVTIKQSDNIVNQMRQVNDSTPRLVYDRVPGINHSQPARMFYLPEVYEWLFAHSLIEENRPLHEPTHITPELLKKSYVGIKSKKGTSRKKSSRKRSTRRRTRRK